MAAVINRVCFSSTFSAPVYPTLCARHRIWWTKLSRQRKAFFSSRAFLGLNKWSETSTSASSSNAVVPARTVLDESMKNLWTQHDVALPDEETIDLSRGDTPLETNEGAHSMDIIKSRSRSAKNKEILFERLPPQTSSKLKFTVGSRIITLEEAQSAMAKREPLPNEEDYEKLPPPALQLKRSRTNPPSESTLEMLRYLESNHTLYQKDQELYSQSLPSLLGASVDDVSNIAAEMEAAGFTLKDVDRLLPLFPHILEVNFENMFEVYGLMKKYLLHTNRVVGLIRAHPFLLTLDPSQIRETLEQYTGLGLCAVEICSLFIHYPLLFFTPLNEGAISRIRGSQKAGLGSEWLSKSLMYAMRFRPSKAGFGQDADMVTELLTEYHVDVGDVLIKYPDLFNHTSDQLLSLVDTLCGEPLYLNKEDIEKFLSQIPEVLCQLVDMEALKAHLTLLSEIFTASILRTQLYSVKLLLDYRYDVAGKLHLLAAAGFNKDTATSLIVNSPSLLLQSDLKEKIELLLAISGATHDIIAESARAYLQHSMDSLKARIKFAKSHNSDLVSGEQLDDLLATSDKQFANLCEQTVQYFYSETGYAPLSGYEKTKRRRGRPKKTAVQSLEAKDDHKPAEMIQAPYVFTKATLESIFQPAEPSDHNRSTVVELQASDAEFKPPLTTFEDFTTEDSEIKGPDELSNVQFTPESIPFDILEDPKTDSYQVFESSDTVINRDVEELLQDLRAASFNKDPLFYGGMVGNLRDSGEDGLFWDFGSCDDELVEQQAMYNS